MQALHRLHSSGCGRGMLTSPEAGVVCAVASAAYVHFVSFSLWVFILACDFQSRRLVHKDMSDTSEIPSAIDRSRMQSELVALFLGLCICVP